MQSIIWEFSIKFENYHKSHVFTVKSWFHVIFGFYSKSDSTLKYTARLIFCQVLWAEKCVSKKAGNSILVGNLDSRTRFSKLSRAKY